MAVSIQELTDQLEALIAQTYTHGKFAETPGGDVLRKWQVPEGAENVDQHTFAGSWPRELLNAAYLEVLQAGTQPNAGRLGERMALKLAIDYVSAIERAALTRHMSGIRARCWAAARRKGHGNITGSGLDKGVFGAIKKWIDNINQNSSSEKNTPNEDNVL